jgi:ribonuclease HI
MIKENTLSVDAGYSSKTGIMDYRGVWTDSEKVYFYKKFYSGTNNIGEFLAIVHALAKMKKDNLENDIYTDSNTAIAWVRNKKVNTNLDESDDLWTVVKRAENWLKENSYNNKILKWKTSELGEIKADFNRK